MLRGRSAPADVTHVGGRTVVMVREVAMMVAVPNDDGARSPPPTRPGIEAEAQGRGDNQRCTNDDGRGRGDIDRLLNNDRRWCVIGARADPHATAVIPNGIRGTGRLRPKFGSRGGLRHRQGQASHGKSCNCKRTHG
jgi:hypothetical protein